jgi:hypothetical protein
MSYLYVPTGTGPDWTTKTAEGMRVVTPTANCLRCMDGASRASWVCSGHEPSCGHREQHLLSHFQPHPLSWHFASWSALVALKKMYGQGEKRTGVQARAKDPARDLVYASRTPARRSPRLFAEQL